jgi:nitrite reductase (NO-forming)
MSNEFEITRRSILAGAAFAGAMAPLVAATVAHASEEPVTKPLPADLSNLERVKIELVKPPFVHAHSQKAEGAPKIHEVTLTIQEKTIVVDDEGTEVHAMTFDGSVPGPMIVVHQDDYVELTLINPETNELQHNIDFHAATGALGGGALTLVNPRREGGDALQGHQGRRVRLSLRPSRNGALACDLGHERRYPRAAARRAEGPSGAGSRL